MNLRLKNIKDLIKTEGLDGLFVTCSANISYLTKYNSRDSYLLVSRKECIYFTDSRYLEEAKITLKGKARLAEINNKQIPGLIAQATSDLKLKRLGFEGNRLSFALYKKIEKALPKKTKLVQTQGLVESLREIKEPEEVEKIRKANKITLKTLEFAKSIIKPGRKEIEVVAELERFIRYHGASNNAFDIIVASGSNSSFPHHISGQRKIRNNELVLIDIGIDYQGYKSDLTRVFFLGKMSVLAQTVCEIVQEAHNKAIKAIKPGINLSEIDAVGRQYIAEKGYGEYFGHSLGHGIGLEVHESPRVSGKETRRVKAGMVFTIEPAIYLPKKFGIRIENNVYVTEKGCINLSGSINQ
jgi:Xaa-Pro aminopeptidase